VIAESIVFQTGGLGVLRRREPLWWELGQRLGVGPVLLTVAVERHDHRSRAPITGFRFGTLPGWRTAAQQQGNKDNTLARANGKRK